MMNIFPRILNNLINKIRPTLKFFSQMAMDPSSMVNGGCVGCARTLSTTLTDPVQLADSRAQSMRESTSSKGIDFEDATPDGLQESNLAESESLTINNQVERSASNPEVQLRHAHRQICRNFSNPESSDLPYINGICDKACSIAADEIRGAETDPPLPMPVRIKPASTSYTLHATKETCESCHKKGHLPILHVHMHSNKISERRLRRHSTSDFGESSNESRCSHCKTLIAGTFQRYDTRFDLLGDIQAQFGASMRTREPRSMTTSV
mmetsp:Transcript_26868/g.51179  ORF Transcript_26868/g.51179 Transcript_26868/m.51179 type:complete len:266 (+) Transcript_26868:143-940(+)